MHPNAAERHVAVKAAPAGIPPAASMAGLTTQMYTMDANVVAPPTSSRLTVEFFCVTWKKESIFDVDASASGDVHVTRNAKGERGVLEQIKLARPPSWAARARTQAFLGALGGTEQAWLGREKKVDRQANKKQP